MTDIDKILAAVLGKEPEPDAVSGEEKPRGNKKQKMGDSPKKQNKANMEET